MLFAAAEKKDSYALDFQTPPLLCDYVVGLLPDSVRTVLEPFPGIGNMVTALKKGERFQIDAPENYFALEPKRYDAIVMNPPFSETTFENLPESLRGSGMRAGYAVFFECLQKTDICLAIMPTFVMLDSDKRMRNMLDFGMKSVTFLPRRTFGFIRVQTAVFEMVKGWHSSREFRYYDYKRSMQGKLL